MVQQETCCVGGDMSCHAYMSCYSGSVSDSCRRGARTRRHLHSWQVVGQTSAEFTMPRRPRYRLRLNAVQPDIETKKDASASSMRVRLLWSQPRALPRSSAIGTEAQSAQAAMIHVHALTP